MKRKPPLRTAWHEAGHAFMAWYCGHHLECASIDPTLSPAGYELDPDRHEMRRGYVYWKHNGIAGPIDDIIISMAGIAAEKVAFPSKSYLMLYLEGGQADFEEAMAYARRYCLWIKSDISQNDLGLWLDNPVTGDVRKIIAAHKTIVGSVAERLMVGGVVQGEELGAIMGKRSYPRDVYCLQRVWLAALQSKAIPRPHRILAS